MIGMKLFIDIYNRSQQGVRRFAVFFFLSLMCFILVSYDVVVRHPWPEWRYALSAVSCGMACSVFTRILSERRPGRGRNAWIYGVPLLCITGVYVIMQNLVLDRYILMYTSGIIGTLCCFSLYALCTKENSDALFSRIVVGLVSTTGMSILLGGTLSVCLAAFSILIVSIDSKCYLVLWIFVTIPLGLNIFLSYLPYREEVIVVSATLRKILIMVICPVYILLLTILYGYIVKIMIGRAMPAGQMNWFASLAVSGYIFIWFCLRGDTARPNLQKWFSRGCLFLMPVVAVQIFGVLIRYEAYGLTTARWASMFCIVYGIVVMLSIWLRQKQKFLYGFAGICVFISLVTPFNIIDMPAREQSTRLLTLLEINGMYKDGIIAPQTNVSLQNISKIRSSYEYLANSTAKDTFPLVRELVESSVLKEFIKTGMIQLWLTNSRSYGIPLEGYRELYDFSGVNSDGMVRIITEKGEPVFYDINNFGKGLYEQYKNGGERQSLMLQYSPDETALLYFTYIHIYTNDPAGNLRFDAKGYLLRK